MLPHSKATSAARGYQSACHRPYMLSQPISDLRQAEETPKAISRVSSSPTRQPRAGVASRAERTHMCAQTACQVNTSAHATQEPLCPLLCSNARGTNTRCPVANCRTARPVQTQCPSGLTASQQNRRHKPSQTPSQLGRHNNRGSRFRDR
jgi:hypothetical protein